MKLKADYSCTLRNRKKGRGRAGILFLLPGLIGVSAFVLIPFGDVIRRSFYTALSGQFCGLQNYTRVLKNQAFLLAAKNTFLFIIVCLPILLGASLLIALAMYSFTYLERYKALYLLPMAMPAATIVLVWKLLFAKQGFLNGSIGTEIDFLHTEAAFFVLLGTYVWKNIGYTMVLWLASLKAIPTELTEAAKVDGAGCLKCFFYIILPCLKGGLYTITVFSFLNAFKVFREAYLVNGAYPPEEIYMLQHLFNNWYINLDFDKMAAGAVLAAVVLGSVAICLKRLWDKEEN